MFFGVPNRGSDVAGTASGILKLLNTVFNVNRNMIQDLEGKSQRLANIASQFRQVREDRKIPVISFYEQQKYGAGLGLVSSNSIHVHCPTDRDYTNIFHLVRIL